MNFLRENRPKSKGGSNEISEPAVQAAQEENRKAQERGPEPTTVVADPDAPIAPPPEPRHFSDLGLNLVFVRDIVLKTMFRLNIETATRLSRALKVSAPICAEIIEVLREQKLVETLGTTVAVETNELRYQLTQAGRDRALDALDQCSYYGPLPVPLHQFERQAAIQSIKNVETTRPRLEAAMSDLVIDRKMFDKLGPAANSGKSIIFYGPPGNGKSSISSRIRDAFGAKIYIPFVLEYQNQVISMYDPVIHEAAEEAEQNPSELRIVKGGFDQRYVFCKRPAVITGGELQLSMLDLTMNEVTKIYQAPLQLKASGGVYVIDDLGRQSEPPQAFVNRWITPLETGEDILAMTSGEKFAVPFDVLLILSTNFHPKEIFDGAALRRINNKILIPNPTRDQMLKIYMSVAKAKGIEFPEEIAVYLFTQKYPSVDNQYASFHPIFIFEQVRDIAVFEGVEPKLTKESIDRAWNNLFI